MKLFVALSCFLVGCLAQGPQPCKFPPRLSGRFSVVTQDEKLFSEAHYEYNAKQQSLRIKSTGILDNKNFSSDALLLFKEATMYEINDKARTCKKVSLKTSVHPFAVPQNASLLSEYVLGASSAFGEGLLVNAWTGELPNDEGKYFLSVTDVGCVPVNFMVQTQEFGWEILNFYDNIIRLVNPADLDPPSFCNQTTTTSEKSADFFSLFRRRH
ncbi:uncharacterized protein V6R79_024145 [Siganus canaliculatus]